MDKRKFETNRQDWHYRKGDIYKADLDAYRGSVQGGIRPVVVLQNNDGNYYCPTLIIAPITSKLKKLNQPTHLLIEGNKALEVPSIVLLEQIITVDKRRILDYLGKLSRSDLREIDDYVMTSLGITIPDAVTAP